MERPLRVGGRSAAGGIAVGVAAVITTACLPALYVPGMPAMLDVQPYVILGLWRLLGVVFLVRVPGEWRPVRTRRSGCWRGWRSGVRPLPEAKGGSSRRGQAVSVATS